MGLSSIPLVLRYCALAAALMALLGSFKQNAKAVTLQFDYTYDTAGFFGTAASPTPARVALEWAALSFSPFTDELAAIEPGGGNAWVAYFRNPSNGAQVQIPNLLVPQNTIHIFVGSRDLAGGKLAEANYGLYSVPQGSSLTPAFSAAMRNRGQGDAALDFAPWGGAIEFDTASFNGARNWHFDLASSPAASAFDFYTVAVHELAHLLGFGTAGSFSADVAGGVFNGPATTALYGGGVPLAADNQHWGTNVGSPPFAPTARPTPSLAASLPSGQRRLFTPLDYAAMVDTGWQVAPELLSLPGDIDGDRDVDGRDWLDWQRNLGGYGGSPGDVNGDLRVDGYDGWLLRHNFGGTAPAAWSAVPEPMAPSIFGWGIALAIRLGARRRRAKAQYIKTVDT